MMPLWSNFPEPRAYAENLMLQKDAYDDVNA